MRKFIQVDDNTWQAQGEDWTYRENHFYNILVVSKASKFSPQRKFCVHLSGVDDSGYHYDTVIRSFDGLEHAQAFAAKLAALLSEEQTKPLADFIKIEDELRDDYEDFKTVYFDADKHNGDVDLVKFSYALGKLDFDLDILGNLIDQLHAKGGD